MNLLTSLRRCKQHFLDLSRGKKIVVVIGGGAAFLLFSIWFIYLLVTLEFIDEIPSSKDLVQVQNPLASELYDSKGNLLGKYYVENRSPITVEDINEFYKNALIATEDIRFYKHNGVDKRSLLRVFFKSILLQKDASGGGSTITQQLAKNLYPRKRYKLLSTLVNKFREMEIAMRLEEIYEKDEILMLYSNTVSFGERAFGLYTAAHRFFNKAPKDLLLEEAATLVGMLKATSYYSPRKYPDRAKNRRNVVLGQMAKYDFISTKTYDQISALPIRIDYQPPSDSGEKARYFKEQVRREFNEWTLTVSKPDGSKYDLYKDGLKIYSTLDLSLQLKAEKITQKHMANLQRLFIESWKGGKLYGSGTRLIDEKITSDPYYKSLRSSGKNGKEALDYFTSIAEREFWTWEGYLEKNTTKIDSIKHYLSLLHTGLLAVNPGSGSILVWIGGNDFDQFQFDNINGARQVGSTFKPIVYLAALEKGSQPCDLYDNELITYPKYKDWTPRNSDDKYGGKVSLRGALTHSMNTISVQILFETGISTVVKMAKRLGINNKLNEVPSIVLGTSDVSLYGMVSAYSTLANRGMQTKLHAINRILDGRGNVIYDVSKNEKVQEEQIVESEYVDLLNEMMLNVSVEGTAHRLYKNYRIPYPICGKTGTTQNQSDGWYIGYNQDLAIGAWVGTQDRRIHFRNLGTGSGGRTAMPMVGALFEYAGGNGYMKQKKIHPVPENDCEDIIPDQQMIQNMIAELDTEMDQIKKEIMGEYYELPKYSSNKNRRKKRNKERDRRYREYKRSVKALEVKIKELKRNLEEIES